MSDSPPESDLEMHRRPTRSAPSVWKYCLRRASVNRVLSLEADCSLCGRARRVYRGCGRYVLGVGAIDAHSVFLRGILAEIFDVAENVATTVLADKVPEIRSEAHVSAPTRQLSQSGTQTQAQKAKLTQSPTSATPTPAQAHL